MIRDPLALTFLDASMRKPTLVLTLYLLLGLIYAVNTPIFEASDELWHYPFVRHLADGNPLPVQDPGNVGPWKQEASQQPLYYALAAALTFWVDSSDMEAVRWLNPHVDNGVLTPDGNSNLVIHRPEGERFPWSGTVLAVRLIRVLSVLMGAGTVYLTWRIARHLFPGRPELAWGAAVVNAFTPMFLFISAAVNNDNLAILLSSVSIFLMLRQVRQAADSSQEGGRRDLNRESLVLGVVLGLAALTKTSALGLIPLALLTILLSTWIQRKKAAQTWVLSFVGRATLLIVPVLLLAGWWYIRNYRLYGDWLGWNAFIEVLGKRAHPASLIQLWGERWGFSLSYWGLFGGVNVPMSNWIYQVFNGLTTVAAVGVLLFLVRTLRSFRAGGSRSVESWIMTWWPLVILIAWVLGIVVGLVRWATITWSSQGRLVFPAISAISTLLVAGLFGWLPQRWRVSQWGVLALGGLMFLISAVAPFAWIAPAYRPPAAPTEEEIAAIESPLEVDLGGRMRLLGYDLDRRSVEPGGSLELTLYWQTLAPMDRNWSVFVHLNDPVIDAPVAQRDMYPGQGLLATQLLDPGEFISSRYVIQVPGAAYAPSDTDLVIGLYDYHGGERLRTTDGRDAVLLTQVSIVPQSQSRYPNPVCYNFGDQLALVGYQISPRRLQPGETITLTLTWQALTDMEIDYTVFTHLRDLEDPSNRIYAQHDALAPGGSSNWSEGQIVEAVYYLILAMDTPPQIHEIEVGVYYRQAENNYPRLQLVTPDQRLVDDFLILGKVRVD